MCILFIRNDSANSTSLKINQSFGRLYSKNYVFIKTILNEILFSYLFCFVSTGSCHSHSATIYSELIEKIEQLSKLIQLILVKVLTRAVIISPLLAAFVNYFILDMVNESFRFDLAYWLPFNANQLDIFWQCYLYTVRIMRPSFVLHQSVASSLDRAGP